jgi:hypothetical protein
MDSQHYCCSRLVAFGAFQHPFDEPFLKFPYGFVKQNSAFHHLCDKPFQLISHVCTLQALLVFVVAPAY